MRSISFLRTYKAHLQYVLGKFNFRRKNTYILVIGLLFFLGAMPAVTTLSFSEELLTKEYITQKNNKGLILLDNYGNEFFKFDQTKVHPYVPLAQIPKYVQHATIASEDREFYQHHGVSLRAIVRSLIKNMEDQGYAQGGSTITQQLVKNAFLTPDKNLFRKYQEILLAQQIESKFTKDEILEMYLNSVYFGENAFGIQEASQAYFGKDVQQLSKAESALLIGILPAPSLLSPISGDFIGAQIRQHIVLEKMFEQGFISSAEKNTEMNSKLNFQPIEVSVTPAKVDNTATHFAIMIKDQLEKAYGSEEVARSKFMVKTTLISGPEEKDTKGAYSIKTKELADTLVTLAPPQSIEKLAVIGIPIKEDSTKNIKMPLLDSIVKIVKEQESKITAPKNEISTHAIEDSLNIPSEIVSEVGLEKGIEWAKKLGISTVEQSPTGLVFLLDSAELQLDNSESSQSGNVSGSALSLVVEVRMGDDEKVIADLVIDNPVQKFNKQFSGSILTTRYSFDLPVKNQQSPSSLFGEYLIAAKESKKALYAQLYSTAGS